MFNDPYQSYINEIKINEVLTYEEEKDLKYKILNGSETAKLELYNRNLKFVVNIAKTYKNDFLDINDLISEGNLGMLVALEKFDYTRECRFMTYAVYWIRHYIHTALTNFSRTIRYPSNIVNNKESEPIPGCVSINNFYNINESENNDEFEEVDKLIEIDQLPSNEASSFDKEVINEIMQVLNERESEIITLYYGLDGLGYRNLSEIGEILDITKERVRQLKFTALRKLKSNICSIDSLLNM